jgi:hypothetical protein
MLADRQAAPRALTPPPCFWLGPSFHLYARITGTARATLTQPKAICVASDQMCREFDLDQTQAASPHGKSCSY